MANKDDFRLERICVCVWVLKKSGAEIHADSIVK
jgi:hypothetical protein